MNHSELYSMSIGKSKEKPIDPVEQEVDEALKHESARLHKSWLGHPITEEMLDGINKNLDAAVELAINQACLGQDNSAVRNLIKAKAFKEVINYVRREQNNDSVV